jgi:hypothetical protein
MRKPQRNLEISSPKEKRSERKEEAVIYHSDTTSIATFGKINNFNIYYSWTKPLEEPSNKKVMAYVKTR